jgi:hypothetical protein
VAYRSVPRPSSPPGAKASTECPSLARDPFPPCTETILSITAGLARCRMIPAQRGITLAQHITVASEHLHHRGDAEASGQTCDGSAQRRNQNLIHPDKDPFPGVTREPAPPFGDTSGIAVSYETKMPITVASPRYARPGANPGNRSSPHSNT